MGKFRWFAVWAAMVGVILTVNGAFAQQTQASQASSTGSTKSTASAPAAMTNRSVIRLVQAKVSDDIIISKIKSSKTHFDTSVDGLVALKNAGVSDHVIDAMVNAGSASSSPSGTGAAAKPSGPASNGSREAVATGGGSASRSAKARKPPEITQAPPNYGMYIESEGKLQPLGRIETKVQISKFRSLLKSVVPFVRQKVDINVPGAHASARFEETRPIFYAYFPPSRDVSKYKLLQCKITGQKFDQRTLANASILFSTEQNQDEVPTDIGPTSVKDLYKITPREDIPSGEFGFVEGDSGTKSASDIAIIDVYDFGIDRKEEKLGLKDYLDTQPPASAGDTSYLSWTKEQAQQIADQREAKIGLIGSMTGWFKRQYASLDVYWADNQFARAFARLEMLDKNLTPDETNKLCAQLLSQGEKQYFVLVSIGGKIGSGHLIGANEGERLMRPFDASLTDDKSKDIVPAKKLDFIGGYAGLWKVAFDQDSIRGPLMGGSSQNLVFEARLNQNLDFKATFAKDKINAPASTGTPVTAGSVK
jgi:hypothetical protein